MYEVNIILFDDFELLDAFGPAEIFGKLMDQFKINYFSKDGEIITSAQKSQHITRHLRHLLSSELSSGYTRILLIPGGEGTRALVEDTIFIQQLSQLIERSDFVLSVCTGAALMAKGPGLNGRKATTNKRAFGWVASLNEEVDWVYEARWVRSGHIYTSSGISAGMDMTLGFISDQIDKETAEAVARRIEYVWHSDPSHDVFAKYYKHDV